MDTIKFNSDSLDIYWSLLKHLNSEAKLELISRLIDSLKKPSPAPEPTKKELKIKSWKDLYGAWADEEETAEEMIERIEGARLTNFNKHLEPFD